MRSCTVKDRIWEQAGDILHKLLGRKFFFVFPECAVRIGEAPSRKAVRVQHSRGHLSSWRAVERGGMVSILFEFILQLVQGVEKLQQDRRSGCPGPSVPWEMLSFLHSRRLGCSCCSQAFISTPRSLCTTERNLGLPRAQFASCNTQRAEVLFGCFAVSCLPLMFSFSVAQMEELVGERHPHTGNDHLLLHHHLPGPHGLDDNSKCSRKMF